MPPGTLKCAGPPTTIPEERLADAEGEAMFRRIFLLACTGGGIWGALYLLKTFTGHLGVNEFRISGEGVLLAIPVGMVGAVVGALLGSFLYPSHR
jgi:hypothetical protein